MISFCSDVSSCEGLTSSYACDAAADHHHPKHALDAGAVSGSRNGNTLVLGLS